MLQSFSKKLSSHLPLIFLLILQTVFYFVFRFLDKSYQTWDSAGHISLSIRLAEHLKSFYLGTGSTLYDIVSESNYYPPLFHFLVALLNLFFGYDVYLQLFWVFLTFLISLVVFYLLLLELKFSQRLALSAVVIYSLFPLVANQSRLFHLESALILFILLSYFFLKKSDCFTNSKYSLLFFLSFSALQLTKWYGFLFLVVPGIYALILGFQKKSNQAKIIKTLLWGILLTGIVVLPWYLVNYNEIKLLSSIFATGEVDDIKNLYSLDNLFFYFKSASVYGTFLLPLVVSFIGWVIFLKTKTKYALLFTIQFLIVYLVFTFIANKNLRYIFGLHLYFAFLIAFFVDYLNKQWLSYLIYGYLCLGFLVSGFNQFKPFSEDTKVWGYLFSGPLLEWYESNPTTYSYQTTHLPVKEILKFIIDDASKNGIDDIGITPLVDSEKMSTSTLQMVRDEMQNKNIYLPVPYYQFTPFKSDYEILKFFRDKNVSYVLVPEVVGPKALRNKQALDQAVDFMKSRSGDWFEPIKKYEYGENTFQIYRVRDQGNTVILNKCVQELNVTQASYNVAPLTSLFLLTGNYSFQNITKNFEPGNIYMLELTNYSLTNKTVSLNNLPKEGFTVCDRLGTLLRIKKEIYASIFENNKSCGNTSCSQVTHNKFNLENLAEKLEIVYNKNYFIGTTPLEKFLKDSKVIPLYEKEYNELKDAFGEYSSGSILKFSK